MKKISYLFVALTAFSFLALTPNAEAGWKNVMKKINAGVQPTISTPCETGRVSYYPNGPVERCVLAQPHKFAVGLNPSTKTTTEINCTAVGFYTNGNLKFCDLLAGSSNSVSISIDGIRTTCPDGSGRVLMSENGYLNVPRWCIRAE